MTSPTMERIASPHVTFVCVEDMPSTRKLNARMCKNAIPESDCYTVDNAEEAEHLLLRKLSLDSSPSSRDRATSLGSVEEVVIGIFDNNFPPTPNSPPAPDQGIALLQKCRRCASSPNLQAYFIASSDDPDQEKFSPFDGVIPKPLNRQGLERQLSNWKLLQPKGDGDSKESCSLVTGCSKLSLEQ